MRSVDCRAYAFFSQRHTETTHAEMETTHAETMMDDSDAVLAANLEFDRAFTMRDVDAMEALWARRAPVACVHPGWPPLADRAAVIESWRGILSSPDSPRIACYDERVFLYGDTALIVCEEELDGGTLVASNWFVREDGTWRIAHHQAGQLIARRPTGPTPTPSRLN
jgi:ketosteroid isomerase-like protein